MIRSDSLIRFLLICAATVLASGNPFAEWDRFEKQVRDQRFPKDTLKAGFPSVYGAFKKTQTGTDPSAIDSPWVFPLDGYSLSSIGKDGFKPGIRYGGSAIKGYDFFDGNLHGGHPAYDIFIRDVDQDSRDDRTRKSVSVLAPIDLVVLSKQDSWKPGSPQRGGKYLWTLNPQSDLLLYFAHLDSIIANPGDTLRAGQVLGMVGRTGKNAHARRSPTHLHFMVLRVENRIPAAFDYIRYLQR
ncbi:MAG: M23 family metallopeptidase [Fibrobacteria bacterium]